MPLPSQPALMHAKQAGCALTSRSHGCDNQVLALPDDVGSAQVEPRTSLVPIEITCECGKLFRAKDEYAGRRAVCPACKREFIIQVPIASKPQARTEARPVVPAGFELVEPEQEEPPPVTRPWWRDPIIVYGGGIPLLALVVFFGYIVSPYVRTQAKRAWTRKPETAPRPNTSPPAIPKVAEQAPAPAVIPEPAAKAPGPVQAKVAPKERIVPDYSHWNLDKTIEWPMGDPTCVAFSPDGRTLAVSGGTINWITPESNLRGNRRFVETGLVRLWDVASDAVKLSVTEQGEHAQSVAFYPDGSALVIRYSSKTRVVDAATGAVRFDLPSGNVSNVAINARYKILASDEYFFWDMFTAKSTPMPHGAGGYWLTFSRDGEFFCAGGTVWTMKSGERYGQLIRAGKFTDTQFAAFSHDGKFIATGTGVWETERLTPLWSRTMDQAIHTIGVAFTPDDKYVVTAEMALKHDDLRVVDRATGNLVFTGKVHETMSSMALSPDGQILVTAPQFGKEPIKVWKVGVRSVVD
jgi:hypothetical protein